MVVRYLLITLLLASVYNVNFAQSDKDWGKRGLLQLYGTVAPGVMLDYDRTNIYLHGGLRLYFSEKVAFFSDSYYFMDRQGDSPRPFNLLANHSTFAGLSFHFTSHKKWDPFFSLQPGAAWVKIADEQVNPNQSTINPLIAAGGGINYYVGRFFDFFFLAKYVHGRHLSAHFSPFSLNSIRISGGVGLNLSLFGDNASK